MTRSGFPTNAPTARIAGGESCLGRDWFAAGFQHGGQLDQLRLMLVGVVLAEQELGARGQLGANACSSAAPIAAISPG
jgi:hypothetical protein